MEKRTLMALALSFLVLGFYPVILQKFYPEYYKNAAASRNAKQDLVSTNHRLATGEKINLPSSQELPAAKDLSFENKNLHLLRWEWLKR